MTILAIFLSKKNKVTIFEKNNFVGGAWSFIKYKKIEISKNTNVIVAGQKKEEKYIKKINLFLKKNFKIKIKKNKETYKTVSKYKPINIFKHNIYRIYQYLSKTDIKVDKTNITNIIIKKKQLFLNKKLFDKVYVPTFVGLNKFQINKKVFNCDYKKIISKHLLLVSKRKFFDNFYYVENFNNFFDRALQKKNGNLYFFTARVRKKFKKKKLNYLLKKIRKGEGKSLKISFNEFLLKKTTNYLNFYRDDLQIEKLNRLNKFSQIKIIDTTQFVPSLKKLKLVKL